MKNKSQTNNNPTDSRKPVLFLKRLQYYIAIKENCDARSNFGLIGVGSKHMDNGILDAKQELCDLINTQGGNLLREPGFVPSQNGRTSYGNGSGYLGWKNFGGQHAALRYLRQYFELVECDTNIDAPSEILKSLKKIKQQHLTGIKSSVETNSPVQKLAQIGFKDAAKWEIVDDHKIQDIGDDAEFWKECKETKNALYAFCVEDQILYIGKTSKTIEKRFIGYRDPGKTQATNRKCHDEIRCLLDNNKAVRNMVFPDQTHLHWGEFRISLAAGLEDSLIEFIKPKLNGSNKKNKTKQSRYFITESEQNEEAAN
jgi:hypothetical protein